MIKTCRRPALFFLFIASFQSLSSSTILQSDSLRTYEGSEVVITVSAKETNDARSFPGSLKVVAPAEVSRLGVSSIKDISALVPNLFVADYGARSTSAVYFRGAGARSSGQSVGLYVDDMPYLDKTAFDFEITDIERIDVLSGPQGTLYGRNAMGGIISVHTLSPLVYHGTRLAASIGSYGKVTARASHYAALSPSLGVSLSARYDADNGYFVNQYTGKRADASTSAGGRIKAEWKATDMLSAALMLSYDYVDQGAFPYGLYDKGTGEVGEVCPGDASDYGRKTLSGSLRLEYRLPGFKISSVSGYQRLDDVMNMDQDFSPLRIFTLRQEQKENALSQEFAVRKTGAGNYQWSAGIYGFATYLDTDAPVTFLEDGLSGVLQTVFDNLKAENPSMPALRVLGESLVIPGSFSTPSMGAAVFQQSTYNNVLFHGLSLTAGLRLDYERQSLRYMSTAAMQIGVTAPGGVTVAVPGIRPSTLDVNTSRRFMQLLPKVSVKYEMASGAFTYLSVAKGYKAGGYNIQMSADVMQGQMKYDMMKQFVPLLAAQPTPPEEAMSYLPEESWSYEGGLRARPFGGRVAVGTTLFYTSVKDIQLTRFVDSGSGRILANAGSAAGIGAELSLEAVLTDGLTSGISYGYTHAEFNDSRRPIPFIPSNTLSASIAYSRLLKGVWLDQLTASAQLKGAGAIRWTEYDDSRQPYYSTLNAKVGVRKGNLRLDIRAHNLTNTSYRAFYFESLGQSFVQKGKPFSIGAEVSLAF
ncbi:MAG: TonB-dependent receptor [Tannerellaceae bacterium]|jgi:outer membrane receptor protein involved in Fe transport|nr:TonB-dependent receptor [Tannerellaceae bacterium]